MKNLVKILLHKNVSASHIAGYALANLVGLAIVLTAIKFYSDANKILTGADSVVPSGYVVLSKHVKALGGGDLAFKEEEIADLQSQPWVKDLGKFKSSQFSVNAMVNVGGRSISTALFFEAIPDRFIDITPSTWHYTPGNSTVPIILPKDYLSLYNFGFASSQGLPTVSEEIIKIFEELFDDGITIIEWPQFMSEYLPEERLEISIKRLDEEERLFEFVACGDRYEHILKELVK